MLTEGYSNLGGGIPTTKEIVYVVPTPHYSDQAVTNFAEYLGFERKPVINGVAARRTFTKDLQITDLDGRPITTRVNVYFDNILVF